MKVARAMSIRLCGTHFPLSLDAQRADEVLQSGHLVHAKQSFSVDRGESLPTLMLLRPGRGRHGLNVEPLASPPPKSPNPYDSVEDHGHWKGRPRLVGPRRRPGCVRPLPPSRTPRGKKRATCHRLVRGVGVVGGDGGKKAGEGGELLMPGTEILRELHPVFSRRRRSPEPVLPVASPDFALLDRGRHENGQHVEGGRSQGPGGGECLRAGPD